MTDPKQNNEAVFMSWFSDNVSSAQISELRLILTEIEQQAKKTKLIKSSLYDNLDPTTVRKIKSNIEQSKIFKFTHKRQWGQILSTLKYLIQYSKIRSIEIATTTQSVDESVSVPVVTDSEPKEKDSGELQSAAVSISNKNANESNSNIVTGTVKTIDFHNLQSMAFTKPISLSYFGDEKREPSWKSLYVDVCGFLLEDYSDIFARMRTESILGSEKIWLVDEQRISLLRVPKRVAENFYVETNRSASDLIKNIKWLLDKCLVDYENVVVTYSENASLLTESSKSETVNSIDTFLQGDEFVPLREELARQHITTVEGLRTLKLWPFMNRYDIYNIETRQKIFCKVNALLYPVADSDVSPAHTLYIGEKYYGSTVSVSNPISAIFEPVPQKHSLSIEKIEQFILAADMEGVSYDDVKNTMNISMAAVKRIIHGAMNIVDIKGRLIHKDAFIDWEEGANGIERIIEKLIKKNNGYISAAQLYKYAKAEMNMFLNDNDVNDERSVYDIAYHLFKKTSYHGKSFYFYGNAHISRTESAITSNLDIIRNYSAEQGGIFLFEALVDYFQSIEVSTGNLRAQMKIPQEPIFFYYSEGILMCADQMQINEEWMNALEKELETLFTDVGGHIVLRNIPQIWLERLPVLPGRKTWTPLLLQSVLRCYSEELGAKTIQAMSGQAIDTLHSMLVSNDGPIRGFGDVVIAYLIDNEVEQRSFNAEELRSLLADAGIVHGNELIWNMNKALNNDERFSWNATGDHVTVEV